MPEVTALLLAWRGGDEGALNALVPLVHDELRRIARRLVYGARANPSVQATALVKQIAEDGRKDDGNLRYEALTQVSRPNHFTVVAAWRDRSAADAYGMEAKTRAFRAQLGPMAGALYDERFYKALD